MLLLEICEKCVNVRMLVHTCKMQVRLRECLGGHFSCLSFHRQCHVNKWAELCVSFYGAGNLRKQSCCVQVGCEPNFGSFCCG